jgi:23S rRNA pseudouridine955/2504/2580 synthase
MIRERTAIKKYYWTIVAGEMKGPLVLRDFMEKDRLTNTVTVRANEEDFTKGKVMETIATPLAVSRGYTLVEVELITGRTHQIRAHLAKEGFPVIGDPKYGRASVNKVMWDKFQLGTQLLHAARLEFIEGIGPLASMKGKKIVSQLPPDFEAIKDKLFEGVNS